MVIWDGCYNAFDDASGKASGERQTMVPFEMQMFDTAKHYWKSFELLSELRENSKFLEACILADYMINRRRVSIVDIGGGRSSPY